MLCRHLHDSENKILNVFINIVRYSHQKIATDYRCKGMPLSSFLLKPMQRITRYPLHIKNVRHCVHVFKLLIQWFKYLPCVS